MIYDTKNKIRIYTEISLKACILCDDDILPEQIHCKTCHDALRIEQKANRAKYLADYQSCLQSVIRAYPKSVKSLLSRYYGAVNGKALLYVKQNHYKEYKIAIDKAVSDVLQ